MKRTRKNSIGPVAVIGYGSQGRAIALNLQDSGFEVIVGLRPKSKTRSKARREGIRHVTAISTAVKQAKIICFAFPDHLHKQVYAREIEPYLSHHATLLFLHALSIHFGFVKPPSHTDVLLIAPHAPGMTVRNHYLSQQSTLSAFSAIFQDITGTAQKHIYQLATGIGIARKRLVPTTFEQEAVGDLFGEQAVLCGGLSALIKNGFDILVEHGIPPENAYLEVAYQLDLIVDLIKQYGIEGMFKRISVAARFGSVTAGPQIINPSVKKQMQAVYNQIASGDFPERLNLLTTKDIRSLDSSVRKLTSSSFEKAVKKFSPKTDKN